MISKGGGGRETTAVGAHCPDTGNVHFWHFWKRFYSWGAQARFSRKNGFPLTGVSFPQNYTLTYSPLPAPHLHPHPPSLRPALSSRRQGMAGLKWELNVTRCKVHTPDFSSGYLTSDLQSNNCWVAIKFLLLLFLILLFLLLFFFFFFDGRRWPVFVLVW